MTNSVLFNKIDVLTFHLQRKQIIKEYIATLDDSELNVESIKQDTYEHYYYDLPNLQEDKICQEKPERIFIDGSKRPDLMFQYDGNRIEGTRFTFVIPFEGDEELFDIRPSQFTFNPPRGNIEGNEIKYQYDAISGEDKQGALNSFESNSGEIKKTLETLKNDLSKFNDELKIFINVEIDHILAANQKGINDANSFGFPIR